MLQFIYSVLGPILFVVISIIGIRIFSYWWSFIFHWKRYRTRDTVTTKQLKKLDIPNLKIQITTRGSQGSSEVIARSIHNILRLASEDIAFYSTKLFVELVTENQSQADAITRAFRGSGLSVKAQVIPKAFKTENTTQLKARGLHYAVLKRRNGWNKLEGRTFIVHFDEESVMVPRELRKLFFNLSKTDKKILEGPIYYPLEYMKASILTRAMEANRPIGCYECRHVMESGLPLHLHGSNLVIEEQTENEIGWDIGSLDGQAFIAEDYVFGMNAFVKYGKEVFGWHGCVVLEQPPFSVRSAFKQRYRWIFGVLQGMAMVQRLESYKSLPISIRTNIIWGTRYRIATFALGSVVGGLSLVVMPIFAAKALLSVFSNNTPTLPVEANIWIGLVGLMWIGSIFIGSWYNVANAGLNKWLIASEMAKTICVAPIAGLIESSAALWAVVEWGVGKRTVSWTPTPKTVAADIAVNALAATL